MRSARLTLSSLLHARGDGWGGGGPGTYQPYRTTVTQERAYVPGRLEQVNRLRHLRLQSCPDGLGRMRIYPARRMAPLAGRARWADRCLVRTAREEEFLHGCGNSGGGDTFELTPVGAEAVVARQT